MREGLSNVSLDALIYMLIHKESPMYNENKLKLLDHFSLIILILIGILFIVTAVGHRNKINDTNNATHITKEVNCER